MTAPIDTAGLPADLVAPLHEAIEHLNDHHYDSLLFVARHATGKDAATTAEITALDRDAVVLRLDLPDHGWVTDRVEFTTPANDLDAFRANLVALLGAARDADPGAALTSIEQELAEAASQPTWTSRVCAVRDLSPSLVEVTLRGGLEAFSSPGGDAWLTLVVPRDRAAGLPPDLATQRLPAMDPAHRPRAATYTVRRFRPDVGELDLWVVLHDHHDGIAGWARDVRVGDQAAVTPPHRSWHRPDNTTHLLLVGDETALPAIAAILDELGSDTTADVVVETVAADHVVDLDAPAGVTTRWVFRGTDAPGTGTHLLDAVADLDLPTHDVAVFGAGEASQVRQLRSHLRDERGLARDRVRLTGYWRRNAHPTRPT